MAKRPTRPRFVLPASIQLGDVIRVTYPENAGIVKSVTGRVAKRDYSGSWRVLYTSQGAILLQWRPDVKAPRVTLLEAADETRQTLPGMEKI